MVLVLIFFLGTRTMPLVSTLGFEAANLFVLVFGPLFCVISAVHKTGKYARHFSRIFFTEFLWVLGALTLYTLLLCYNGVLNQSCSPGFGFIAYFLTLVPPVLLNLSLGSLLAALVPHAGIRLLIFFLCYPAYICFVAWSWWQEANFRLLTHASLILNSDLLTGGSLDLGMAGFRIATTLIALTVIAFGIKFVNFTRPNFSRSIAKTPFLNFFLVVFLFSLAVIMHWQSVKSIGKDRYNLEQDYSLIIKDGHLIVRANPELISEEQAKDILFEAKLYEQRIAESLGSLSATPLTIWLHSNDEQKFAYTGAKNVHFALPKRREIHISESTVPHPILGHELAHIYVGEHATTLLGVPGSFGIVPNMALTEGLAMFLSPELAIDNDLTMFEQAQAFYQAGLKVDIVKLFSINPTQFALYNPRSSYIFAGAFLEFIFSNRSDRITLLKNLIAQGSIDALFATDKERDESIEAFNLSLATSIPDYAVAWAKKYFLSGSILETNCQELFREQRSAFKRNILNDNLISALASIATLTNELQFSLINDAKDTALNEAHYAQAEALLNALFPLIAPTDPRFNELKLEQAEILIANHRYVEAKSIVDAINAPYLSLSAQRAVGILSTTLDHEPEQARAMYGIIFAKTNSIVAQAAQLGLYVGQQTTSSPLFYSSSYLYARLLINSNDYRTAAGIVDKLLDSTSLLPEFLLHETKRMQAEIQYKLKNYLYAKELFQNLEKESTHNAEKIISEKYIWHINDILQRSLHR